MLRACFLILQPSFVVLEPRIVFFLGALADQAGMPVEGLVVAVRPVGQLRQLAAAVGLQDGHERFLEGLSGSVDQGLGLVRQYFDRHLGDGPLLPQFALLLGARTTTRVLTLRSSNGSEPRTMRRPPRAPDPGTPSVGAPA